MKRPFILWITRGLAILYLLFLSLFSLDTIPGPILPFLIHNIPSFILIIITIVAWKKELIGGILFLVFAVALWFFLRNSPTSIVLATLPLVTGLLFIWQANHL